MDRAHGSGSPLGYRAARSPQFPHLATVEEAPRNPGSARPDAPSSPDGSRSRLPDGVAHRHFQTNNLLAWPAPGVSVAPSFRADPGKTHEPSVPLREA